MGDFGGRSSGAGGLQSWWERHGEASPRLVNMYGITETTVHVTYRQVGARDIGNGIGTALDGVQVYILDEWMQPVPVGVGGEIYVGGTGVARGYVGQPDWTAERFLPDPYGHRARTRLYRTGDRGRWLAQGQLEYLGRIDEQVKLRGYRIELGEIETALREHPNVRDALVVMREQTGRERQFVAYVIRVGGTTLVPGELRRHLQRKLPEHMVCAAYVEMQSFPLTTSGKVDRRALPTPAQRDSEADDSYEPPRTPLEQDLTQIWAGLLKVNPIGIHDNFFALGGDSILSIRVQAEAQKRGISFSIEQLFSCPSIESLAAAIENCHSGTKCGSTQTSPFSLVDPKDFSTLPRETDGCLSPNDASDRHVVSQRKSFKSASLSKYHEPLYSGPLGSARNGEGDPWAGNRPYRLCARHSI